jgi:hypothetical protein
LSTAKAQYSGEARLAVIMHNIWVTGEKFEFGSPATAAKAA